VDKKVAWASDKKQDNEEKTILWQGLKL